MRKIGSSLARFSARRTLSGYVNRFSAAALFIAVIMTVFIPLMTLKASASSDIYAGVKIKSGGSYSAALLDADFYDSKNGCLTQPQESQILDLMQQTADKVECNIGIAIVSDLHGMSDVRYADRFGDEQFGSGSSFIVLLLLNTHDNPKYSSYKDRISTSGLGRDYYDRKVEKIFDKMYDGLDSQGFAGACRNFCSAVQTYKSSGGYSSGSSSFHIDLTVVLSALVVGIFACAIVTTSVTRGYKKKTPISASHYIDKTRTRIIKQTDQFVREHTTSVHISSSSGGHSSGHHGGGGGSHRSGGHGGGGGRHR